MPVAVAVCLLAVAAALMAKLERWVRSSTRAAPRIRETASRPIEARGTERPKPDRQKGRVGPVCQACAHLEGRPMASLPASTCLSKVFDQDTTCCHGGGRLVASTSNQAWALQAPLLLSQVLGSAFYHENPQSMPLSQPLSHLHLYVVATSLICVRLTLRCAPLRIRFYGLESFLLADVVRHFLMRSVSEVYGDATCVGFSNSSGSSVREPLGDTCVVSVHFVHYASNGQMRAEARRRLSTTPPGPNSFVYLPFPAAAGMMSELPPGYDVILPICQGLRTKFLGLLWAPRGDRQAPTDVPGKLAYYDLRVRPFRTSSGRCRDCALARVACKIVEHRNGHHPGIVDAVEDELKHAIRW